MLYLRTAALTVLLLVAGSAALASDVAQRIGNIVAEQLRLYSPIVDLNSTLQGLGADELDMVEITLELESAFDIVIPDESVEKVSTVQDLVALVEKTLSEKPE